MPRPATAAIATAAALVLATSRPASGQEYDSFLFGNVMNGVVIHLDTLGVLPRPGADSAAVVGAAVPYGMTLARTLPDGLFVFGVPQALSRSQHFARAMNLETSESGVVEYAGPLLRMVAGDFTLVATSQVIVQFDLAATVSTIDSLNAEHGVLVAFKTPFKPNHFLLQLAPQSSGDALQIARQYNQLAMVEYAYPNFLSGMSTALVPNDPFFPKQWHLSNDGRHGGTAGADIQAVDAWDIEVGKPDVVIAVIELNGFEVDHPDLQPNLWDNPGELGGDQDSNGFMGDQHGWNFGGCVPPGGGVQSAGDPGLTPPCGSSDLGVGPLRHGTAVAGLAAARGNNGTGVTGVCQLCRLMLIRTSMADYSKYLAFLYAAHEGAHVINASWTQTVSSVIKHAIVEAAGPPYDIPIVFGANHLMGKDVDECTGPSPTFASLPEVIAVSWSDNTDVRVFPSGYGNCIDLVAPGAMVGAPAGVATTDTSGTPGYNDMNPIGSTGCPTGVPELVDLAYTRCFGGTSASAPIVSGTIGLMLSNAPNLTRQEITTKLHETAEKVGPVTYTNGFNQYYGYGRVNAFCALGGDGPRCPKKEIVAGGDGEGAAPAFEIGTRFGLTVLSDPTTDRAVTNLPGSGPLSLGVVYVDWFPASKWMVELQLGGANITTGSGPDEREVVAALQPGYFFASAGSGSFFVGANLAGQLVDVAGMTDTDAALGFAAGYRFLPLPFLALRFEGRYRHWFDQSIEEFGAAFQFGVVLN